VTVSLSHTLCKYLSHTLTFSSPSSSIHPELDDFPPIDIDYDLGGLDDFPPVEIARNDHGVIDDDDDQPTLAAAAIGRGSGRMVPKSEIVTPVSLAKSQRAAELPGSLRY
jgi:hypothetical protein